MRLVVIAHKPCWSSHLSPSGYATDGGFPFQIGALADLFDSTVVCVPISKGSGPRTGELPLTGRNLSVEPLTDPGSSGFNRKIRMLPWTVKNTARLVRQIGRADAVHACIPSDIGTIGMLLALAKGKRLFVRHCGNMLAQRTTAEHFWKWFMERVADEQTIMLATGGSDGPPSKNNPHIRWIFSTSLTERELATSRPKKLQAGRPVRLMIACRQEQGKGVDVLIRSLPAILGKFPDTVLDIAGEGSALPQLQALVKELRLDSKVLFHGRLNHDVLMSLMRRADLFCYPTESEGFSKVVLEALSCGLPVITTRVSVLPLLIGEGCGILLDNRSPEHIAKTVTDCLGDPSAYEAMSARAVEVAGGYSLEHWRETIGLWLRAAWGPLAGENVG